MVSMYPFRPISEKIPIASDASSRSFDAAAACATKALDRSSKQNAADAALLGIMELEVRQLRGNLREANLTIVALRKNADSTATSRRYALRRAEALLRSAVLRWRNRKQQNLVAHLKSRSSTGTEHIAHYDTMMACAWAALEEKDRVIARLQESFDSAIHDLNSDLDQVQASVGGIQDTPS
jgi:hypothetical protein